MSIKDKILDFAGLRSAVQSVSGEYRRLAAEIESAKRKREDLAAAPANRADLVAAIGAWVDREAGAFNAVLSQRLLSISRTARNLENGAISIPDHLVKLMGINSGPHTRADSEHVEPGALFLMIGPEAIKSALRREIESLEIPNEGLPMAQRRVELKKLDKQIGESEEQLVKLRREAADAGVYLDSEATS